MSDQQEANIAQGLSQLGETTTAAELLRAKGQSRKLRVMSEKQLMTWILSLLNQHMAGKEDAFSDAEKAELLKKTQDELARRIKREQEAQSDRDRLKDELAAAMTAVSQAQSGAVSQADMDAAIASLKEKLEQAEQINLDLQQDNYDLQDQLNEKMALLSTTISEKDKLRDTVRNQMMRMTALCEGVLGIDNNYYGSNHQETNQVSDDAGQDEIFYHDFDVGAKVIATLQSDLERLRSITQRQAEEQIEANAKPKLLEADLAMLEQLKAGNLAAVDVAAPVAGLIEALDGARAEAESFEEKAAAATGTAHQHILSELPDAGGDAAVVLAGATTVARELAASLARNQKRITALKSMADESDEARHATEEELEQMRTAFDRVCSALGKQAIAGQVKAPAALADQSASPEVRAVAASQVVDQMMTSNPVEQAALEQLVLTDRVVKSATKSAKSSTQPANPPLSSDKVPSSAAATVGAPPASVADRLRKAGQELERYTLDLEQQLEQGRTRERELAKQVKDMSVAVSASLPANPARSDIAGLEQALTSEAPAHELGEATRRVVAGLQANAGKAEREARSKVVRRVAEELVKASAGDADLAPVAADMAVALEQNRPAELTTLEANVHQMVLRLAARKKAAETDRARLVTELEAMRQDHQQVILRADQIEATRGKEVVRLSNEVQQLAGQLTQAKAEVEELQARGQDKSSTFSKQVTDLRREVAQLREQQDAQHNAVSHLNQEVESSQARVRQQREDLTKRLAERDIQLAEKDARIEQLVTQHIDAKALEAKVKVLTAELEVSFDRMKQLESAHVNQAGQAVKADQLAALQQAGVGEREQLRTEKRSIETELSDAIALREKLQVELNELRKEETAQGLSRTKEIHDEREKNNALRDEFRKLKEEVIGLRARLRKLTET